MKLRLIFGLALLSLVFGCSTEVELNAPYKSTTVVFGILDAKESRQYVKINRTYLGDGNNAEYAQIRDSLEYEWDEFNSITMSEIVNGSVVQTYELDSITIENKDTDGVFYAPVQTVYYFDVAQADEDGNYLNPDAIYELNVDFKNKEDVSAQTDIIDARDGNINQSPFGSMVQTIIGGQPIYNENVSLRWTTSAGAKRYEYSLRFYYRENVWADLEQTQLEDSYIDSITWKLGEFETENTNGGLLIEQSFNGLSFYNNVASRLESDPYISREMNIQDEEGDYVSVSLILSIANDELNTFISVNEPVTGIVQERPSYTNVSNGIGILASKSSASRGPIALSKFSREELATGAVTSDLDFCSNSDPQETFSCD
ncbi:hypothetical protein [Halocola ammonii]